MAHARKIRAEEAIAAQAEWLSFPDYGGRGRTGARPWPGPPDGGSLRLRAAFGAGFAGVAPNLRAPGIRTRFCRSCSPCSAPSHLPSSSGWWPRPSLAVLAAATPLAGAGAAATVVHGHSLPMRGPLSQVQVARVTLLVPDVTGSALRGRRGRSISTISWPVAGTGPAGFGRRSAARPRRRPGPHTVNGQARGATALLPGEAHRVFAGRGSSQAETT